MIWILIAHRADAKLYASTGRPGKPRLIRSFEYPEGRRQNREIDTDAKGSRYSTSAASTQMKHGLDPHIEAVEHISDIFAKELATVLREGRTHNSYDELMLVAEPGFLGKIKKFIDKDTARRISVALNRNLSGLTAPELAPHLEDLVRGSRKVA